MVAQIATGSGFTTGTDRCGTRADFLSKTVDGCFKVCQRQHVSDPRTLDRALFGEANGAMYVSFIGLRLTKTSLTLINRTRLRTKGQSAGYPQAQIGITSNSFHRRAP